MNETPFYTLDELVNLHQQERLRQPKNKINSSEVLIDKYSFLMCSNLSEMISSNCLISEKFVICIFPKQ